MMESWSVYVRISGDNGEGSRKTMTIILAVPAEVYNKAKFFMSIVDVRTEEF
jgi:hypothetical protein